MENLNVENLTNEIQSLIKALKDCGGCVKRGNGEGWFNHEILVDALAFITAQEQRIEELAEEVADWKAIAEGYQKQFEDCAEDRARLTEENENVKSDTVLKTLQDVSLLFSTHFGTYTRDAEIKVFDVFKLLDRITEELLEGIGGD